MNWPGAVTDEQHKKSDLESNSRAAGSIVGKTEAKSAAGVGVNDTNPGSNSAPCKNQKKPRFHMQQLSSNEQPVAHWP